MSIDQELLDAGFELIANRPGSQRYTRKSNPYLQWWVVVEDDGTAELQWELGLGEYLKSKGLHVAVQDELSLLLFPGTEMRGPADAAWVAQQIAEAEALLGSVNLVTGE